MNLIFQVSLVVLDVTFPVCSSVPAQAFDELVEMHGLWKADTIGDAYVVVGGLFRGASVPGQEGNDLNDDETDTEDELEEDTSTTERSFPHDAATMFVEIGASHDPTHAGGNQSPEHSAEVPVFLSKDGGTMDAGSLRKKTFSSFLVTSSRQPVSRPPSETFRDQRTLPDPEQKAHAAQAGVSDSMGRRKGTPPVLRSLSEGRERSIRSPGTTHHEFRPQIGPAARHLLPTLILPRDFSSLPAPSSVPRHHPCSKH